MITVIIGHRGTGKTELVKRLKLSTQDSEVEFIDLDESIEEKIGKSIRDLFFDHGESYFRELERQMFLETLQKPHKEMFLVVGAGFDVTVIPEKVRTLWVRRQTDLDGRIFINRPRLNPELSPIQEFQDRAQQREPRYRDAADEIYLMPEGIFEHHHQVLNVEKSLLTHKLQNVGGAVTLMPSLMQKARRWELFKERYQGREIELFELRDDFLSEEFILQVLNEMPGEQFLFSFRHVKDHAAWWETENAKQILEKVAWVDWALELGPPTELLQRVPKEKLILSAHEELHLPDLVTLKNQVAHVKFAPMIASFKDLMKYHQWQVEDSDHRSFLPRSLNGRWGWYRQLQKGQQLINFWRDGEGSASDQPTLFQWMMTPNKPEGFAAVLGDPVAHSFTPIEHSDYFKKRNLPVFFIQIAREEWDEAMPVLEKLGLRYAAVTAPHKENAAKWCRHSELKAVNTLYFDKVKLQWKGTSTDDEGFRELIEGVGMLAPLQKEIFVWGGGGVLPMIEKALPHASYFSSRTGEPRAGSEGAKELMPKVLIWAAPRSPETVMPPAEWNPAMIFDLNYKEDSMGREYAQLRATNYQSGLPMFIGQAQQQRAFWNQCEEKST